MTAIEIIIPIVAGIAAAITHRIGFNSGIKTMKDTVLSKEILLKYKLKRVSMPNAFEIKLDLYDDSARFGFDIILNFVKPVEAEKARCVFIKMYDVALPWNVWELLFAYLKGATNHD